MKFFIGVTDHGWYDYLSRISPDEVNFWRPGGGIFSSLETGGPFLFKLKYPENKIAGGGFFIRSIQLPLSFAWDAFGDKNGTQEKTELLKKINSLRDNPQSDPRIGCTILNQPFFFPKEKWIPAPKSWSGNIVTGKMYDTSEPDSLELWNEILIRLNDSNTTMKQVNDQVSLTGKAYLVNTRIGQGAFKVLVTNAYNNICAITGEKALPVLQAAHILPYSQNGPNKINNGLLLRSDLHILFDRGYVTITDDYKVEVSRRIREEFNNGKNYYALHGKSIYLPVMKDDHPEKTFIDWHNSNIFK
jgi:putative restriction endonuclease